MDFWDGTGRDGFSEGRWNGKAIPIMNELVQMAPVPVLSAHSILRLIADGYSPRNTVWRSPDENEMMARNGSSPVLIA